MDHELLAAARRAIRVMKYAAGIRKQAGATGATFGEAIAELERAIAAYDPPTVDALRLALQHEVNAIVADAIGDGDLTVTGRVVTVEATHDGQLNVAMPAGLTSWRFVVRVEHKP